MATPRSWWETNLKTDVLKYVFVPWAIPKWHDLPMEVVESESMTASGIPPDTTCWVNLHPVSLHMRTAHSNKTFVLIVVSIPNWCSGLQTIVYLLYKFVYYAQIKYFHCYFIVIVLTGSDKIPDGFWQDSWLVLTRFLTGSDKIPDWFWQESWLVLIRFLTNSGKILYWFRQDSCLFWTRFLTGSDKILARFLIGSDKIHLGSPH